MSGVNIFVARAAQEEGVRLYPYDDATGERVKAPQGAITWGIGFNLDQCGSTGLFLTMLTYLATQLEKQLAGYSWYNLSDPVRQSVFLDIAYNAGFGGLMHFPHMLSAAAAGDWGTASVECAVADARLNTSRYAPLRVLLLAGGES